MGSREGGILLYSIVVSLLNEDAIPELYARLTCEMEKLTEGPERPFFELVFVAGDDNTGQAFRYLRGIARVDSRVLVVRSRKRDGRAAALIAGLRRARGRYTIAMDGDLQHRPEDIPRFTEKLEEGYDIVCGWSEKRVDNVWLRRIPTRIANGLERRLNRADLDGFGGGFKAYRTSILQEILLRGGMQRSMPALASVYGASMCQIPMEAVSPESMTPSNGISQIVPVVCELLRIHFLLTFLRQPLRILGSIGLFLLLAGVADGLWLAVQRMFFNRSVVAEHGSLFVAGGVLVLAGIQLLMIGLSGESLVWFSNDRQSDAPMEYAIADVYPHRKAPASTRHVGRPEIALE